MNTPSPLIPQGAMMGPRGKSHIRIAVFTILAVHVVLLGALLLQGCKPSETPPPAEGSRPPSELIGEWPPPPPPLPSGSSLTQRTVAATMTFTNQDRTPGIPSIDSAHQPPALPSDPSLPVPPPVDPGLPATSGSGVAEIAPPADAGQIEHTVARGDSFFVLARRYNTTTKAIADANPNKDPRKLQLGDTLLIPKSSTAAASSSSNATDEAAVAGATYQVRSGDTLTKIAKLHNTSIQNLRVANNLSSDRILVGQKLAIPK